MTISKAYSYLERDDVLERRPGLPLIVKPFDAERLQVRKVDLLRENLAPIVTMVQQLGLNTEEAQRIFGEMLHDARDGEEVQG